jgi:carbon monoxide dehydrogenase subunit G
MASIELHRDFTVRRPVAEVFDLLADLETYLPQWAKGPVAVRKTTPGPKRTGTRLTVTALVGPVKVRSPYEITAWKPHEVFGGSGTAGPFVFDEEYRLAENPDGHTAVSYTIAAEPRGVFRIARRPLAARARTLIEGDLARFVRLAESRP